jgi:hypothetical protein
MSLSGHIGDMGILRDLLDEKPHINSFERSREEKSPDIRASNKLL